MEMICPFHTKKFSSINIKEAITDRDEDDVELRSLRDWFGISRSLKEMVKGKEIES